MIKLIDILYENEMQDARVHWRDHFKKIIECAERALSSNDPEVIATEADAIMDHADAARAKHEASYTKAPPPVFVNSNIANSYAGDDSDIHAYQDQRI